MKSKLQVLTRLNRLLNSDGPTGAQDKPLTKVYKSERGQGGENVSTCMPLYHITRPRLWEQVGNWRAGVKGGEMFPPLTTSGPRRQIRRLVLADTQAPCRLPYPPGVPHPALPSLGHHCLGTGLSPHWMVNPRGQGLGCLGRHQTHVPSTNHPAQCDKWRNQRMSTCSVEKSSHQFKIENTVCQVYTRGQTSANCVVLINSCD